MRIAVVAASGRSGVQVVGLGRDRSHDVTAVVRDSAKFGRVSTTPDVRVAVADLASADDLARAFADADAVVFCVGPVKGESGTVQSDGIVTTLKAMEAAGVSRVVVISNNGMAPQKGDDYPTRFIAKPIVGRVLREEFADMARMEDLLRDSPTRWTIVRPPRLTDKPAKGRYRSNTRGGLPFGFLMTRADLAAAVLDAVIDDRTIGQTITVAN